MSATATPATQSSTTPRAVGLDLTFDVKYASGYTPRLTRVVIHLDHDFGFDPSGFAQCDFDAIHAVPESTAKALCPNSQVGSGNVITNGGLLTGRVAAFNGRPSGGRPTVYLHTDIFVSSSHSYSFTVTDTGVLDPGAGTLTVSIPPTGTSLNHLFVSLFNREPTPGHPYVSARCGDVEHLWNFSADFGFDDASVASASTSQGCQAEPVPAVGVHRKCKKTKHKKKRKKRHHAAAAKKRCRKHRH